MKKQSLVDCFFILPTERDLCLCPPGYADERCSLGDEVKTVDNCFYRSETAQIKELKEGAGRPTRNDYATVEGNASSVACDLALLSEKSCLLLGGRTRRA